MKNCQFGHYVFKNPSAAEAAESAYMRERVNPFPRYTKYAADDSAYKYGKYLEWNGLHIMSNISFFHNVVKYCQQQISQNALKREKGRNWQFMLHISGKGLNHTMKIPHLTLSHIHTSLLNAKIIQPQYVFKSCLFKMR